MRAAPRAGSAVVETLGLHFVHVLGYEATENDDRAGTHRMGACRHTDRQGRFRRPPGTLRPLSVEQLCYVKDVTGRWRIAGYVGRGD